MSNDDAPTNEIQENEQSLETQIDSILDEEPSDDSENQKSEIDEAEEKEEQQEEKSKDVECPSQFLNEDGSIKVQDLIKSYQELEPLANQKADWDKEKSELQKKVELLNKLESQQNAFAIQQGYQNHDDMQISLKVAEAEANEYYKYLYSLEEADRFRVQELLAYYSKVPSPALLKEIESEFNVDVVKNISLNSERYRNQLFEEQNAQRFEQYKQEAEAFVKKSIEDYPDWFKIPEFTQLFKAALEVKGDAFETSVLIKHLQNLKEYFRKEFIAEQNANTENEKEKKSLTNLSPKSSTKPILNKKLEDYTDAELEQAIEALV